MTYIVDEECIKCKYMDCVEVCPVISEKKIPPKDAKNWENKENKFELYFDEKPGK